MYNTRHAYLNEHLPSKPNSPINQRTFLSITTKSMPIWIAKISKKRHYPKLSRNYTYYRTRHFTFQDFLLFVIIFTVRLFYFNTISTKFSSIPSCVIMFPILLINDFAGELMWMNNKSSVNSFFLLFQKLPSNIYPAQKTINFFRTWYP